MSQWQRRPRRCPSHQMRSASDTAAGTCLRHGSCTHSETDSSDTARELPPGKRAKALFQIALNLVQRAVRHKAEAIYKCTCVCVSAARSQRCRAGLWKSLLDPHVGTQRNTSVPSPPHKVALLGTGVSGFANTTHLINTSTASSSIFSACWLETGRVGPEPGHRGVRSVPKP